MASDRSSKVAVLRAGFLFLARFTVLVIAAALAQVTAAGQPYEMSALSTRQNASSGIGTLPVSKFAYVADQHANTLSAYTIDSATGSLTEIPGSPFAARELASLVMRRSSGKISL